MKKMSPKATAALDRVVTRFKSGDLSPLFNVATLQRDPPLPFDGWSYRNRVLAYAQSDHTDLRGFRQWKAAGRWPRKGTAVYIWAPCHVPVRQTQTDADEKPTYRLAGYSPIPVYSAKDTDGREPLVESHPTPPKPPPLMDLAQSLDIDVHYLPNIPGVLGNTNGQRVHLNTEDTHVWFHELAHCLHRRLNLSDFVSSDKARRETIADFTAAILMEAYGLQDTTGNTWNYIRRFNPDPLKAIYAALGSVEQIITYLDTFHTQATQKGA